MLWVWGHLYYTHRLQAMLKKKEQVWQEGFVLMLCFQRDGRVRPEDFMVSKALCPLGKAHSESPPERASQRAFGRAAHDY